MLAEIVMNAQASNGNPARQLASKPDVVKRLSLYRDKIKALATVGLGFEPCTKADLMDKAFDLHDRHGLLTNDSVILAVAMRVDADALVSVDARF